MYHNVNATNTRPPRINENGAKILWTVGGYIGFDANQGYCSGISVGVRIVERNLKTATLEGTIVTFRPC